MGQDKVIAVIDYGLGNLKSVANALEYLGEEAVITGDPTEIEKADRMILPGVGSFAEGTRNLRSLGLADVLNQEVIEKGKPFLGICLGMQLIARTGYEDGVNEGLGWVDGTVVKLDIRASGLKIPHMGWNDVQVQGESPFFRGIRKDFNFYFVHSYHLVPEDYSDVIATCEYGIKFVAAIKRKNILATQFHPEKSQQNGLKFLENFLDWTPE